MFERFTEDARTAMALANQEAQRYHHEYIGTEHVLLGVILASQSVGADILHNVGVDTRSLRQELEKVVKSGPKTVTTEKLPQTLHIKMVVEYAISEARALHHPNVGTEHLLLGILRVPDGHAAAMLTDLGLHLEAIRNAIVKRMAGKACEAIEQTGEDLIAQPPSIVPEAEPVTDPVERLRQLIQAPETLVTPDAYDPISAQVIVEAGFEAVQCSGYSMACSLGLADERDLSLPQNLATTERIVKAVQVPVIADAEDGYGNPVQVPITVRQFLEAGVAGISLEDQVMGCKNGVKVIAQDEMIEKLQAARAAAEGRDFVLNARTDALKAGTDRQVQLQEAIKRANAYLEAGADMVFVAYVESLDEASALVKEIQGPVGIGARMPYNMHKFSVRQLIELKVARVHLPTINIVSAIRAMRAAMQEIQEDC